MLNVVMKPYMSTACYVKFILLLHSFFVWKISALNMLDEM